MVFVYGSTFRLDNTGEIIIEPGGDISLVTEYDKIAQDLNIILRSQKYQYLFDTNFGVDYMGYLNGKSTSYYMNKEITTALQSYYFIDKVNSVTISKDSGNVSINANILLINGNDISINVIV